VAGGAGVTDEQEIHWSATVASNPICHDYWRTKWFDVIPPKKLLALLDEVVRLREIVEKADTPVATAEPQHVERQQFVVEVCDSYELGAFHVKTSIGPKWLRFVAGKP
jgi:hypothetical protein